MGLEDGNVMVHYTGSALRNRSMVFTKHPIGENQLSQIV